MTSSTLSLVLLSLCVGLYLQIGHSAGCPANCVCAGTKIKCSSLNEFPMNLPVSATHLTLTSAKIRDIPPHAFKKLTKLTRIEISDSTITHIQGCAFEDLPDFEKISITHTAIGYIEEYSFSFLNNVGMIELKNCTIDRIKSFAFYKIVDLSVFRLIDSVVRHVDTRSLYGISNVVAMLISSNEFGDIATGAMKELQNISRFSFIANNFTNMHCGVVDDIMHSNVRTFQFERNNFYCDCSVYWLVNSVGSTKYAELKTWSSCYGPENLNKTSVNALEFDDIGCNGMKDSSFVECKQVELTPKLTCPTMNNQGVWVSHTDKTKNTKADLDSKQSNGCSGEVIRIGIWTILLVLIATLKLEM